MLLSTPFLAQALLEASPQLVASGIRAATTRADALSRAERLAYGRTFQERARAHAAVQLYRTFLLREVPALGRYRDRRLVVPTRLLVGAGDPVASRALLGGWEPHADDMEVEILAGAGHFLPEEAPVAAAARSLFG